jgi:hypothetical protein
MLNPHIIRKTTDPTTAPPEAGIHWINTVTNKEFFSVGTSSLADWSERTINTVNNFEFVQPTPLATWTINHNLGFNPSVQVFSSGGLQVDAEIQNTTVNQTIISFVSAFAGYARLN